MEVVIDNDPEEVQIAGFVNEFFAGTVAITKTLAEATEDDAFLDASEWGHASGTNPSDPQGLNPPSVRVIRFPSADTGPARLVCPVRAVG